jgi:hypothetical protein
MSFKACIEGAVGKTITKEQADEAIGLFDELEVQYNKQMGPGPAQSKAAMDAANAMKIASIQRKRRVLLQAQSWKSIQKDMATYRGGDPNSMGSAAIALLEQDTLSRYPSVAQLHNVIQRRATSMMEQVLATFRRDIVGRTRNKATMKNLIREAFGENTGDAAAKEMATAWGKASDYLASRYNAAGGAISKRSDWALPQSHSAEKVKAVSYEEWRSYIVQRLDTTRMIDQRSDLPFTPERLELALKDSYDAIRTNGVSKLVPSGQKGGRSIATRHQDHRFFVFKNADSWMEYQGRFGNPEPFDVMLGHIDIMSREIALMERLGPNPTATLSFIGDTLQKAGVSNHVSVSKTMSGLYSMITGSNNAPINSKLALTMAGVRQGLQAAQLGSAALAALTDLNFQRITRQFNGLPQMNTINNTLKMLVASEDKGRLALRLGLTAEGWSSMASGQMRFVGDMSGPEVMRRVSDFVMRASLLSPWTTAGRWTFGMEFLGTLADNTGKSFDALDPNLRSALTKYGIGEDRWEILRKTTLYDYQGAKFLRADDVAARTDIDPRLASDIADKMLMMIDTETNYAVPSTSLRGRLALTGDVQPGTFPGEILRSFAMYKNFSVTLLNTHIMRGITADGAMNKAKYLAGFAISTTLMGALAMQTKEIVKQRDPIEMFSKKGTPNAAFWGAAMMQGGGLSIFGDFLFADLNRYDRGLAETIAGPVVGLAQDLKNLTIGNMQQMINGQDTNVASEALGFASRYMPGASVWYIRGALERTVIDQVRMMIDPDAKKRMRDLEKKYKKDRGQEYWWRPGQMAPDRAPNLGAMFGQ